MTSKIRSIIGRFKNEGVLKFEPEYIIEDPFFVDSKMPNIIQIADFVSWVMKQWYSREQGKVTMYDEFNRSLFNLIKEKFDTGGTSSIFGEGLKIHPPSS